MVHLHGWWPVLSYKRLQVAGSNAVGVREDDLIGVGLMTSSALTMNAGKADLRVEESEEWNCSKSLCQVKLLRADRT